MEPAEVLARFLQRVEALPAPPTSRDEILRIARELGGSDDDLARAQAAARDHVRRGENLLREGLVDDALAEADAARALLADDHALEDLECRALVARFETTRQPEHLAAAETTLRRVLGHRPDDPGLAGLLARARAGRAGPRGAGRGGILALAAAVVAAGLVGAWAGWPFMGSLTVTGVSPLLGPPGQWVYVSGSGFVEGVTTVSVGGVEGVPTQFYDTDQIGFTVPAGATGSGPVEVVTGEQRALSTSVFTVGTPTEPPVVTGLSPAEARPGDWVYVSGSGFVNGATTVVVGGMEITGGVYGPSQLGFTVPELPAGPTEVRVRTDHGEAEARAPLHLRRD